jgi:hypothetical protein
MSDDEPTRTVESSPIKQSSPMVPKLCAALVKAQASMGPARKTGANPHFRSSYATLSDTFEAVREPFAENGLGFTQGCVTEGVVVNVTTRIYHASGEWMEATTSASARDNKVQSVGSTITYLRRYGLQAMAGLSAEDDDGEAAMGRSPRPVRTMWEGDQRGFCAHVNAIFKEAGVNRGYEDLARYCETQQQPRPSSMTREQRKMLTDYLSTPEGMQQVDNVLKKENK